MNPGDPAIELSIVATVYNDAKVVPLLVDEFMRQMAVLNLTSYEIILVNDNSPDDSETAIIDVCQKYKAVKGISLARNYGQQIAMSAGVRHASGKYVLIIDGDLENPVETIPQLYNKITQGYDVVYTVSKKRQSFFNRITSGFFWFVVCKLLRINIVQNQLMLRIMSRRMVNDFNTYNEITRSVMGVVHDIGLKSFVLEVEPKKRIIGKSNYNFFSRLNLFIDIILNLSIAPLDFVIFVGFFTLILSFILAIFWLYVYFTGGTIAGYTSLILSIFFFGSMTVFTLGIISRYLSLIYLEVRNRPLYLVKEKFNL
jgi:glycosyltransferase involved in cell wall biosynthesis